MLIDKISFGVSEYKIFKDLIIIDNFPCLILARYCFLTKPLNEDVFFIIYKDGKKYIFEPGLEKYYLYEKNQQEFEEENIDDIFIICKNDKITFFIEKIHLLISNNVKKLVKNKILGEQKTNDMKEYLGKRVSEYFKSV